MASKKRKLEEDEHNNDQLNPVVITSNEVRSRSREDEDTIVEQQQLVVASTDNQALSYQLAPRFDPVFNRAPMLYQWQPHFGSLNQPASSSNPTFNPGPLLQQPRHGFLNQPGSSSIPAINRAPLHQLQPPHGSLNQPRSGLKPIFDRVQLHELQPPRGSLNQPRSSLKPAVNQSQLLQLLPPHGSLNEPGSSSTPPFNRVSLHELQPPRGSLNQPRSSLKPIFDRVPLHELQPPRGSLNQPRSSSKPAVNRPQLLHSPPPRGSLNEPGSSSTPPFNQVSLHELQPPRGSLNQPRSSLKPTFNRVPLHELQPPRCSLNQPRSSSKPAVNRPPLPPRSNEVQQNSLPPCSSTQGPHTQLTLMTSQQSSNHMGDRINMMLDLVNGLKATIETLEAELYAMKQTVQPISPSTGKIDSNNVLPPGAFQGGGDYRSQPQWINADHFNSRQTRRRESEENMQKMIPSFDRLPSTGTVSSSNVLLSRAQDGDSDNAKLPYVYPAQGTRSGPGSTSGYTTAGDESEGPASIAAGEVFSATDTGEEENADTSQDGNTRGNSSAR